jgi:DNA ligase (NAD+)
MKNNSRYKELVDLLNRYDIAYRKGEPLVTDDEYDRLYKELLEIEKKIDRVDPNSPTQKVSNVTGNIKHITNMLSLKNAFTDRELKLFHKSIDYRGLLTLWKYDGISCNIIYKDGKLDRILTRGDGEYGEDITKIAKSIQIPLKLKYTGLSKGIVEVRGELVLEYNDFDIINDSLVANNEKPYSNPRNAVAGIINRKDGKFTDYITFKLWGFGQSPFDNLIVGLKTLANEGFKSPELMGELYGNNIDFDIITQLYKNMRENLAYPVDGLVFTIIDIKDRDKIGYGSKYPKWAIAYKFPAIEKETTLLDVIPSVGKTGAITPVGVLEPIDIDGVTVTKATLHNYKFIKELDLNKNDRVFVIRSGDVIPKILGVNLKRRKDILPIIPPTKCPRCFVDVEVYDEGILIKCPNPDCPAKIQRLLEYAVSRDILNIDNIGPSVIEILLLGGYIKNLIELLTFDTELLSGVERFGSKSINNIKRELDRVKSEPIDLWRLIATLPIEDLGKTASKQLTKVSNPLEFYKYIDEIKKLPKVNKNVVKGIQEYFSKPENIEYWKELVSLFNIKPIDNKEKDKIFITGKFDKSRNEILDLLSDRYELTKGYDADVYLIGEKASKKKIDKIPNGSRVVYDYRELL